MKLEARGAVPFLARSAADELASRPTVGRVAGAPGIAVRHFPGAVRSDAKRAGGSLPRPLEARYA